ncbi:DUF4259 domain-containing protein [Kitasatospora brasiliensis]|nr:DUF4259 domain-containing protein [Kitasatospora sp. K002]
MGTWDTGHFDNDAAADFCGGPDAAASSAEAPVAGSGTGSGGPRA